MLGERFGATDDFFPNFPELFGAAIIFQITGIRDVCFILIFRDVNW